VRELPDGTRILGVYTGEGNTAYGGIIRSTDAGKTWSVPNPIGKGSGVRLNAETDFVTLRDGTLYAALRGDRVNMHFATSPDSGLTWSPVKDIGFPAHCPHFTRVSTGEILLTHRLPQTSLHISRDDGKTWQGPYQIDSVGGAYPSTVELKDGSVLVVYYEEGAGSAIRARRFKLTASGIEFLALWGSLSSLPVRGAFQPLHLPQCPGLRFSDFGLPSAFGFRASDLSSSASTQPPLDTPAQVRSLTLMPNSISQVYERGI
jgi:hypothetical protein